MHEPVVWTLLPMKRSVHIGVAKHVRCDALDVA